MISRTLTGPNTFTTDPTRIDPRVTVYTNPANIPNPLPPGASVSEVQLPSTPSPGGIDMGKAKKWLEAGQFLFEKGKKAKDNSAMLDVLSVGAAMAGPVGAAVAVVLQVCKLVLNGFGLGGGVWGETGPGVHAWITTVGPQAFLDYVRANNLPVFSDIEATKQCFVAWSIDGLGFPMYAGGVHYGVSDWARVTSGIPWTAFGTGNPPQGWVDQMRQQRNNEAMPEWLPGIYEELGIDYAESVKLNHTGSWGFSMRNVGIRVDETGADNDTGSTSEGGVGVLLALAAVGQFLKK